MSFTLPDPATEFGARVAARLHDERIIWLTTTGADGTPQPNPVWFLWDGASFLIYSLPDATRLGHLKRNEHAALHFDGNGSGGDIVVFTGIARVAPDEPPANERLDYLDRYRQRIDQNHGGAAAFAAHYSVALRFTPTKVRGH